MKPNARSVLTALKRIKDIPYHTVANGHGPLIRCLTKHFPLLNNSIQLQCVRVGGDVS